MRDLPPGKLTAKGILVEIEAREESRALYERMMTAHRNAVRASMRGHKLPLTERLARFFVG